MTRKSLAPAFKPGFRLWLCGDDPKEVFGYGKCRLLQAIEAHGSLTTAAAELGISYRKAWGDLIKAEKALGVIFLERRRGGNNGGETHLTEAGVKWLREYERFHDEVEKAVDKAFIQWRERTGQ